MIDYVNGFRHRLYTAGLLAKEKLASVQDKMKQLYDIKADLRVFSPGDQVLALLPIVLRSTYGSKADLTLSQHLNVGKQPNFAM